MLLDENLVTGNRPDFAAENVLDGAGCDWRICGLGVCESNYWMGDPGTTPSIILDLGCQLFVKFVDLKNAHNAGIHDR